MHLHRLVMAAMTLVGAVDAALALPGEITDWHRIANGSGGLPDGTLTDDSFGWAVSRLADLDGDGVAELLVGSPTFNFGEGHGGGLLHVLFLASDGSVRDFLAITQGQSGFDGDLGADWFGAALADIGDLGDDGLRSVAVGCPHDSRGGFPDRGAVRILDLDSSGLVSSHVRIGSGTGGFSGDLEANDGFGTSLATPGDIDGDGVSDLIVGTGSPDTYWALLLNDDSSVKANTEIALGHSIDAIASIGDLDGNGVRELAVGKRGAGFWVLFLEPDGSPGSQVHTTPNDLGIDPGSMFGGSLAWVPDLDGNGVRDLAIGAPEDDDGADGAGAFWFAFLDGDGSVLATQKVSNSEGGFGGALPSGGSFGRSLTWLGQLEEFDYVSVHIAAGNPVANDAAVWTMTVDGYGACCYGSGACFSRSLFECNLTEGTFQGTGTTCDPDPCATSDVENPTQDSRGLLRLHPNPANDRVSFSLELAAPTKISFSVFDLDGRMVIPPVETRLSAGSQEIPLPRDLASGAYILRLRTDAGVEESSKFTILR